MRLGRILHSRSSGRDFVLASKAFGLVPRSPANVYLDVHPAQADFTDGALETAYLYKRYFWSGAGYPDALSTLPTLTTWDDHEFWNNAPEPQFHLSRSKAPLREPYLNAAHAGINTFQAPLNPPSIAGTGSYIVDDFPLVSVFVLDARTQRSLKDAPYPELAPQAAINQLAAWAAGLRRPGVLVIGQPLLTDNTSLRRRRSRRSE